jgi:hypothetical protein
MSLTPLTVDYPLLCDRDLTFVRKVLLKWDDDDLVKLGGSFRYGIQKDRFLAGQLEDPEMVRWCFHEAPLMSPLTEEETRGFPAE